MKTSHYISFLLAAIGAFVMLEIFVRILPEEPAPRHAQPSLAARDTREPILHPSQLAGQRMNLVRVSQTVERTR